MFHILQAVKPASSGGLEMQIYSLLRTSEMYWGKANLSFSKRRVGRVCEGEIL